MIIIAGIGASIILIMPAVGGITGMIQSLPPGSFSFPLGTGFNAVDLVSYLLIFGLVYVVGPDM
jgi:hypothetical protein